MSGEHIAFRVWRDPVWSKVIAAGIISLLALGITFVMQKPALTLLVGLGITAFGIVVLAIGWSNLGEKPALDTTPGDNSFKKSDEALKAPTVSIDDESIKKLANAMRPPETVVIDPESMKALSGAVLAGLSKPDAGSHRPEVSLPGFQLFAALRLGKRIVGRDNFIFDAEDSNNVRFSVLVDVAGALRLRVLDDKRKLEASVSPGLGTFIPGNLIYLVCQYGVSDEGSFASIEINGREAARSSEPRRLRVLNTEALYSVIGADLDAANGGVVDMIEWGLVKATSDARTRAGMLEYGNRVWPEAGVSALRFSGAQFMATADRRDGGAASGPGADASTSSNAGGSVVLKGEGPITVERSKLAGGNGLDQGGDVSLHSTGGGVSVRDSTLTGGNGGGAGGAKIEVQPGASVTAGPGAKITAGGGGSH